MVFTSSPVVSVSRFAALPVGAQSRQFTFLARRINRIEFTNVVLPTPGPPVMIATRLVRTVFNASRWLGARVFPVFVSHQTTAFSNSILGYFTPAEASRLILVAIPSSALQRRQEDQRFAVGLLQQQEAAGQHLRYRLLHRLHCHLQQFHGRRL